MLLGWWVQQPSLIVPDAAMPFKLDDCLIFIGLTGNLQKASPIMHWIYLTMKEWSPSEITLEVIMIASGRTVLDSTAMTEWLGKYESTSTTIQSVFKKQLDAAAGPWEQEKFEQFSCQLNCHYGSTILDGWWARISWFASICSPPLAAPEGAPSWYNQELDNEARKGYTEGNKTYVSGITV